MIDLKLIRLITGEEIVAEVVDWSNGIITVKNALAVIPHHDQIGFAPWATVIDPEFPDIALDMKHVVYSVAVAPGVIEQYKKIFGNNIITPEKRLIL